MSDNTEKLQNLSIDEQKPEGTTAPEAATEPVILGYVSKLRIIREPND